MARIESKIPLSIVDDNGKEYECDMCGRCCTAVSINSILPDGTKFSKKPGERCVHLGIDNLCKIWGDESRQPEICRNSKVNNDLCRFDLRGDEQEAKKHFKWLMSLDRATRPS